MNVTYRELKESFPKEKERLESIYGRIIPIRKISYLFSIPLIKRDVPAYVISVFSMVVAVFACFLISINSDITRIIGIILVVLWHVLDCVDGNIARYTKTASDFGSAIDAICGYFVLSYLPLALGIAAYNIGINFFEIKSIVFLIFGALGSISQTLMRLIHQKYIYEAKCMEEKYKIKIEKGDNPYKANGFHRIRKIIDVEFGMLGIPMFVLWICPIFKCYGLLAMYYGLFNTLSLIAITVIYLKKCIEYHE